MTADQISKNLKLLKIDIWVHSVLLFLGIMIPLGIFAWSFTLSNATCSPYLCFTPRDENILLSFIALFVAYVISIIWQIISWFLHRKFQENHTTRTQKIRKIIRFYYVFLIISCASYFGLIILYLPNFLLAVLVLFFLLSPFFWLVYYVNLFSQRKNLELELNKISTVSAISK
jgi:hypothetical protein